MLFRSIPPYPFPVTLILAFTNTFMVVAVILRKYCIVLVFVSVDSVPFIVMVLALIQFVANVVFFCTVMLTACVLL